MNSADRMVETAVLDQILGRVAAQVRRRRAEHYGLRGAFYGALASLAPLLGKEVLGPSSPLVALVLFAAGVLAGAIAGLVLASPRADVARLADRAFGLEDRIATALEWAGRPDRTPLVDALIADAVERVERIEITHVVPRRVPREARLLPLPVLAAIGLALLPGIPLPAGQLPDFSATAEDKEHTDRAANLQAQDRAQPRSEPVKPGELSEREVVKPVGGAVTQSADRPALFKDTALSGERPDFASFVKKGDERLRLLEQTASLPDLKSDYTRTETRAVMQQAKALAADFKSAKDSQDKLKELLEHIQQIGHKQGGEEASHTASEGLRALRQGDQNRAIDAMNRSLNALRESDEDRPGALSLTGGRQGEGGRQAQESGESREQGSPNQDEPGAEKGKMAGTGTGKDPTGDPTPRLNAKSYDTMIEGDPRDGQKESMDTNMYGQAASVPSRLMDTGAYDQYRRMMEDAIAREQVPRDYQPQVKSYFRAIGGK